MQKLGTYMKRYGPFYLLGFVCMVVSIILDMAAPQLIRHIIDDVIVGRNQELFMRFILGLLGIGMGRAVLQYIKELT